MLARPNPASCCASSSSCSSAVRRARVLEEEKTETFFLKHLKEEKKWGLVKKPEKGPLSLTFSLCRRRRAAGAVRGRTVHFGGVVGSDLCPHIDCAFFLVLPHSRYMESLIQGLDVS